MIKILKKLFLLTTLLCSNDILANNFTINGTDRNINEYDSGSFTAIDFASANQLDIDQANSNVISSIITDGNNQGEINFETSSKLTVDGNIGSMNYMLDKIISSNNSNIEIDADNLYANILDLSTTSSDITISGSAILNFNDIQLSSNDFSVTNNINIFGNITGSGKIIGNNTDLNFTGSNAQSIGVAIGESGANRISSLIISGSNNKNFSEDVFLTNIDFTNSNAATINLSGSNNQINLTGNITANDGSIANITSNNNSNILNISGSSNQNLNAKIGNSTSSRFGIVNINNANSNITFGQESYIDTLNINSADSTLTSSDAIDINALNINQNTTLNGNSNVTINNLTIADSIITTLDRELIILGNINGTLVGGNTEIISGINGSIAFNGNSAQSVSNLELGRISQTRLGTIKTSNINGINLEDDLYVNDIIFENSSGTAILNISSGKTFDIGGNIITSSGTGIITGDGTVKFSGSNSENINANLGESASSRIANVAIENPNGVIFNNNAYINNFTHNNNNFTVTSGRILDIANSGLTLSNNQNINFKISSNNNSNNPFGQINLNNNNLAFASNNNIFFDYSNFDSSVNFDYNNATYDLITNASTIDISNITYSDNSYLFDNLLIVNGNDLQTNISKNSEIFTEDNLGISNVEILDHAISNSNLASSIMSISSESELDNLMNSIRLPNNSFLVKHNLLLQNNINNINSQRIKLVTLFPKRNKQAVWGEIFGSQGERNKDTTNQYDGFTTTGSGIIIGYDYINSVNLIGISALLSTSKIENDNIGEYNSQIESSGFSIYNRFGSTLNNGFYNINSLNYIINNYDNERKIILPSQTHTAISITKGTSIDLKTEIGYNFPFLSSSIFSPNIAIEYFLDQRDAYQESGSSDAILSVKEEEFSNLILEAGFDIGGKYYTKKKNLLSPMLEVSLRYHSGDKQQINQISFNNNNQYLDFQSAELPSQYANIAFSMEYSRSQGNTHKNPILNLKYNSMIAEDFLSHTLSFEIRYNFNTRSIFPTK